MATTTVMLTGQRSSPRVLRRQAGRCAPCASRCTSPARVISPYQTELQTASTACGGTPSGRFPSRTADWLSGLSGCPSVSLI